RRHTRSKRDWSSDVCSSDLFALFYPQRVASTQVPRLDLVKLQSLTFEEPDLERFPCLAIAREIASCDSTLPCALNAANEVAVDEIGRASCRESGEGWEVRGG